LAAQHRRFLKLQQRQQKRQSRNTSNPSLNEEQEASCLLQDLLQQPSQTVDASDESVVGSVVDGRVAAASAERRVREVNHAHVHPRRAPRPLQLLGRRPLFLRAQRVGTAPTLAAELHVGRLARLCELREVGTVNGRAVHRHGAGAVVVVAAGRRLRWLRVEKHGLLRDGHEAVGFGCGRRRLLVAAVALVRVRQAVRRVARLVLEEVDVAKRAVVVRVQQLLFQGRVRLQSGGC
jgi:hypothetical protein